MPKILKKEKVLKISKRHFTVVIKNKENGLYISSTPSLAAKKAVSKLCASDKQKKVEFYIREITRDSKKKTYGPYVGYLEKLKIPIKLKEYIIKYNPIVKLIKKSMVKKIVMRGGTKQIWKNYTGKKYNGMWPKFMIETDEDLEKYKNFSPAVLVYDSNSLRQKVPHHLHTFNYRLQTASPKDKIEFRFRDDINEEILQKFLERQRPKIINIFQELEIQNNVIIYLDIPYFNDEDPEPIPKYERIEYLRYEPEVASSAHNPKINSIHKKENIVYLNLALRCIGIKECLILFGEFLRNFDDNISIISVGSGIAYFENLIQELFKREVVCVDPNPVSFNPLSARFDKKIFIRPQFNVVDNLLSSKNKNKYNNCLLILNWPSPGRESYDFNAISRLKPLGFFIIYEREGISGSEELIDKLNERQPIQFKEGLSYELLKKKEYSEIKELEGTRIHYNYIVAFYRRIEP